MQSRTELLNIIRVGRPDLDQTEIDLWVRYLSQLESCELQSVIAQSQDEEAWLKEREKGIGGSEIAAIAGRSPWNTAYQIWLGKTKQYDELEKFDQSEAARWGNVLEKTVADEWAFRNKRKYINIPVILRSCKHRFMFANIDGFTLSDDGALITGILEIKTTRAENYAAWAFGPIPEYYLCQANWYTAITGLERFTIVCLVGGQRLFSYEFPLNTELMQELEAAAVLFWTVNIGQMVAPEIQAGDDSLMLSRTADVEEEVPAAIYTDDASENLAEAYCNIRSQITTLTNVQDVIKAKLLNLLSGTNSALTKTHTLKLQGQNRRSCDFETLLQKYPGIYDEVINVNKSTSLQVK